MIDPKFEQDAWYEVWQDLELNHKEQNLSLKDELRELEILRITDALRDAEGNNTYAANILKIGRTTLLAKMKKYKINF
jgi:transcriptional regulator with PAS, ATPase and Fis domain